MLYIANQSALPAEQAEERLLFSLFLGHGTFFFTSLTRSYIRLLCFSSLGVFSLFSFQSLFVIIPLLSFLSRRLLPPTPKLPANRLNPRDQRATKTHVDVRYDDRWYEK